MVLRFSALPRRGLFVLCTLLLALVPAAAGAQPADIAFKRSSLVIVSGDRELKFDVELATNDAERQRGLMYRKELGPYQGMLFDFYREEPVSFWMKNTLIPLDMLFVNAQGRIVNIHQRAVPESLDVIAATAPVRAVIELNGGTAARLGIAPGDQVQHPIFGNES